MSTLGKVFFWFFVIILGFVNPLISIALVVIYYLPKIISDACSPCSEVLEETEVDYDIKSYSDDILEDMK